MRKHCPPLKWEGKRETQKGRKYRETCRFRGKRWTQLPPDAFSFSLRGRRQDCLLRVRGPAGQLEVWREITLSKWWNELNRESVRLLSSVEGWLEVCENGQILALSYPVWGFPSGVSTSRSPGKASCWVYLGVWYYQLGLMKRWWEILILVNFYWAHYYSPGHIGASYERLL